MIILLVSFAISVFITALLVRSANLHAKHSGDWDFTKPQKFHTVSVPRIGGVGIVLGVTAAAAALPLTIDLPAAEIAWLLLLCSLPAFLAGAVQDFTESISPRGRLVATAVSALLSYVFIDTAIRSAPIPGVDWLVSFVVGALFVTVFAVTGIAHAVNIIDGFNGLASMCVVIMLAAIGYVAFQVDDRLVGLLALAGIGALLGFFPWNFPAGLIFLVDGGAYFLGFYVAEVSILLLQRNPDEVSPLCPLLVCIYPVFETLFSVYRRGFLRAVPISMPDGIHLHTLIYRRILRWAVGAGEARNLTLRNSMTSPYLWILCMLSAIPAVLFWDNTPVLYGFLAVFAASYLVLYWRIVRFRSPRWLKPAARRTPVLRRPGP